MAAEIFFTGTLTISPENMLPSELPISQTMDMSGDTYFINKQAIPAGSATPLAMGAVPTAGVCWFKNTDSVNFIDLRNGSSGQNFMRILPGEVWPVRVVPTMTLYALADTGTVDLEYLVAQQ